MVSPERTPREAFEIALAAYVYDVAHNYRLCIPDSRRKLNEAIDALTIVDVQGIAAIAWRCIRQCKDYVGPPVMCPAHQEEAHALVGNASAEAQLAALQSLAAEFVRYWTTDRTSDGCGMCGGIPHSTTPHSTTCYVGRMHALMVGRAPVSANSGIAGPMSSALKTDPSLVARPLVETVIEPRQPKESQ